MHKDTEKKLKRALIIMEFYEKHRALESRMEWMIAELVKLRDNQQNTIWNRIKKWASNKNPLK